MLNKVTNALTSIKGSKSGIKTTAATLSRFVLVLAAAAAAVTAKDTMMPLKSIRSLAGMTIK